MANNLKSNMGKNTTSITNPKTKSQNTGSTSAPKSGCCKGGKNAMSATGAKSGSNKASGSKGMSASQSASKSGSTSGSTGSASSKPAGGKKGTQGGVNAIIAKNSAKNNKMEAATDCPLKDMDIISDVLGSHKALIKLYGTALCECDCTKMRTLLNSQMSEAATDQYDAFLYMNQRGMYPTEQAPANKVKQALKQYTQKESAFKNKK